ncbi:MAG: transglutaminase-like putative cysteine protease [Paracoccaceae bacterium]|jgi:transglutaminase-like putative cysteine protease|tara:strand:- start:604 stop:1410 length:807 start_codon:yes stop_codon:yes gene_type:complete
MKLSIQHTTTYRYEEPVNYSLQQLRLTPKSRIGQSVLTWQTSVMGGTKELEFDDHHMNRVHLISYSGDASEIVISSQGEIETADMAGVVGKHAGFTPLWYFLRSTGLTRPGARVRALIKDMKGGETADVQRLHDLSDRILAAIPYKIGETNSGTASEDALGIGSGVCQDHAHIFISAARLLGYPARYVSGYLMMDTQIQQNASHAWAEAHVDGLGWVGFDVSNAMCPDDRYVRVSTGLDYSEAAPVHGVRFGSQARESLHVDIQVQQQ